MVEVPGLADVVEIVCGGMHAAAITRDGKVRRG